MSYINDVKFYLYDYVLLEKIRATFASYFGCFKNANTHNLKLVLINKYSFMRHYFCRSTMLSANLGTLKPLYKHQRLFSNIWQQYHYFRQIFTECILFFQVGSFYEFYAEIKPQVKNILGLNAIMSSPRGLKYGFPVRLMHRNLQRLLRLGCVVIIIQEADRYIGRVKERLPWLKILPANHDVEYQLLNHQLNTGE